jgi:allantoin racemase
MRERRIIYISPGGSGLYDDHYQQVLSEAVLPGTRVDCVHLPLEEEADSPFLSPYPFYHSELFRTIKGAEDDGYQAAIIGCSADPGLLEARRMVDMPVTGPLEANLHLASMLRKRVAILVPGTDEESRLYWDLATSYGLARPIAEIVPLDLHYPPAEELARVMREDPQQVKETVLRCHRDILDSELPAIAREVMKRSGAGAIYCGCTLWTGMLEPVARALGVPVLDAGIGALRMAEVMADRSAR